MKLLQWNIWYKEDIQNILKTIKEINPDIVCIQELAEDYEMNKEINTDIFLQDGLGMNMFYEDSQRWATYNKTSQGNAIYSKFPIISTESHFIKDSVFDTKNWSKEGRIYIEVELEMENKKLTVGTTHLSYIHGFKMNEDKKIEMDNLLSHIKLKKHNYLFSADLNSTPNSYPVKEIEKYLIHAGPDYSQNSWTTKPFDDGMGFKEDKLNWRLDYVFCTSDIQIKSSEIIHTSFSDHLPVLIEFEIS